MVSADGTISSFHYHIQAITPKGPRDIQTIELGSELTDGTFLTTSNSLQSAPGRPILASIPSDTRPQLRRTNCCTITASDCERRSRLVRV